MVELAIDNAVELDAVLIDETDSQGTPCSLYLVTAGSQRFLLCDGSYTSLMKELNK